MSDGEETKAQLLGYALVPRPDRLVVPAAEQLPAEVRGEAAKLGIDLASLGLSGGSEKPSAALRQRILASASRSARKALLVVDMVCDHLTPGSLLEVPRAREVVPSLAKRIENARRHATQTTDGHVLWRPDHHHRREFDFGRGIECHPRLHGR